MDFPQIAIDDRAVTVVHKPMPTIVAKAEPAVKPTKSAGSSKTVKVHAPGQHVHTCPYCSTEWSHADTNVGNTKAHTCPQCGLVLPGRWIPTQSNTRIINNVSSTKYCPPGRT